VDLVGGVSVLADRRSFQQEGGVVAVWRVVVEDVVEVPEKCRREMSWTLSWMRTMPRCELLSHTIWFLNLCLLRLLENFS